MPPLETRVLIPQLGNEIDEAQVDAWLKAVGDRVALGEPLLTISTPKVTVEIESPADGIVKAILIGADELAGVGAVVAIIESA